MPDPKADENATNSVHGPRTRESRKSCAAFFAELAAACGTADLDGLKRRLGPRWAYRLRGAITTSTFEEYAMVIASLAKL
jgi:hypothetical protein